MLREVLSYGRGQSWRFVNFTKGEGWVITNESAYGEKGATEERRKYALADPSILAIKGLGQFQEFRVVSEVRSLIENWHVSNLHVADIRRSIDDGYAEHLSPRGHNAALVARYLRQNHPEVFDQVLQAMGRRVPGIEAVEATPTGDGRLVLRFYDGSFRDPFIARHVSDGTTKMFAYLLLLRDPKPHPLLAVEEPENQLYPHLLRELASEFRNYAKEGGQVFVSSHSPEFLNGVDLREVFFFSKEDGFSKVVRPADDEHLRELANEGEANGAPVEAWAVRGRVEVSGPRLSAPISPGLQLLDIPHEGYLQPVLGMAPFVPPSTSRKRALVVLAPSGSQPQGAKTGRQTSIW